MVSINSSNEQQLKKPSRRYHYRTSALLFISRALLALLFPLKH